MGYNIDFPLPRPRKGLFNGGILYTKKRQHREMSEKVRWHHEKRIV
jgi:hypothetical protein